MMKQSKTNVMALVKPRFSRERVERTEFLVIKDITLRRIVRKDRKVVIFKIISNTLYHFLFL
jgi:hypothetical protein